MSLEAINSLDFFKKIQKKNNANLFKKSNRKSKISRGYVNNFSTREFGNFVKSKKMTV